MVEHLDFQAIATTLMGSAEKTFTTLCGKNLSGSPKIRKVDIVTWYNKMKIFGWEKFHKPTYVSVIFFYSDQKNMEMQKPVGLIILYLERKEAYALLKTMGLEAVEEGIDYDVLESAGDKTLADSCGELCNIIAGSFKTELCSFGYPEFIISPPSNYVNEVPDGVPYNQKITSKYEIFLPIGEKEIVYIDIVIPAM